MFHAKFGVNYTPYRLQCMANLSRLVAGSFFSLALLSSSISTANLSCLLVTTFASLRFLSYSLLSPRFNILRVARRSLLTRPTCRPPDTIYHTKSQLNTPGGAHSARSTRKMIPVAVRASSVLEKSFMYER